MQFCKWLTSSMDFYCCKMQCRLFCDCLCIYSGNTSIYLRRGIRHHHLYPHGVALSSSFTVSGSHYLLIQDEGRRRRNLRIGTGSLTVEPHTQLALCDKSGKGYSLFIHTTVLEVCFQCNFNFLYTRIYKIICYFNVNPYISSNIRLRSIRISSLHSIFLRTR